MCSMSSHWGGTSRVGENRTFGDPQVTADDHGEHRIYNVQVQLDVSPKQMLDGENSDPTWAMP